MADKARWFGSMRIRPDGRMSFSPWSYPDLPHVALSVTGSLISVVSGGVTVMFLYPERNRVLTACFVPDLEPEKLRSAVAELRNHARGGLDSWIVPALEWNLFHSYVRERYPAVHEIIPELLESCRELPVAQRWGRIRENVRASADWTKAETPPKPAGDGIPAIKSRDRRSKATQPKRRTSRK